MKKLASALMLIFAFVVLAFASPIEAKSVRRNLVDSNMSVFPQEMDPVTGMHTSNTFSNPTSAYAVSSTAIAAGGTGALDVSLTAGVSTSASKYRMGYRVRLTNTGTDWVSYQYLTVSSSAHDYIPLAVSGSVEAVLEDGTYILYKAPAGASRIRMEVGTRQ